MRAVPVQEERLAKERQVPMNNENPEHFHV